MAIDWGLSGLQDIATSMSHRCLKLHSGMFLRFSLEARNGLEGPDLESRSVALARSCRGFSFVRWEGGLWAT